MGTVIKQDQINFIVLDVAVLFGFSIPNKPNTYGIKFQMICDATSKYIIDADPHIGRSRNAGMVSLSEFYIKK